MSGVEKKPVVIDRDVVSIQGGFLAKPGLASGIMAKCKDVDGKVFISISGKEWKMKRFLNDNYKMVEYLRHLRNKKVESLMKQLRVDQDPLGNEDTVDLTSSKRTLYCNIPEVLQLQVKVEEETHDINVLSDWREFVNLAIELNDENLELLLKAPDEYELDKKYETVSPGIVFHHERKVVYSRIPDKKTKDSSTPKKRRSMSEKVAVDDTDGVEKAVKKLMKRRDQMLEQETSSDECSEAS